MVRITEKELHQLKFLIAELDLIFRSREQVLIAVQSCIFQCQKFRGIGIAAPSQSTDTSQKFTGRKVFWKTVIGSLIQGQDPFFYRICAAEIENGKGYMIPSQM